MYCWLLLQIYLCYLWLVLWSSVTYAHICRAHFCHSRLFHYTGLAWHPCLGSTSIPPPSWILFTFFGVLKSTPRGVVMSQPPVGMPMYSHQRALFLTCLFLPDFISHQPFLYCRPWAVSDWPISSPRYIPCSLNLWCLDFCFLLLCFCILPWGGLLFLNLLFLKISCNWIFFLFESFSWQQLIRKC